MRRTKSFITSATLLALILISCSIGWGCGTKPVTSPIPTSLPNTAGIPANYTTYTDESNVFSISYPSDWEEDQAYMAMFGQSGKRDTTKIKAGMPIEEFGIMFSGGRRAGNGWVPYLDIEVGPLTAGISTLDRVVDESELVQQKNFDGYQELSRIKTTVDGREAIILEWQGNETKDEIRNFLQLYTIANKAVWEVDFITTPNDFAKWHDDCYAVLNSLRILK
jgi:hypothetical protein